MSSAPAPSPMWCAHHWPDDYDRCVHIGDRHVCRRCAVLYPLALIVAAAGLRWGADGGWVPWVMVLAPVPTVLEWCAEHLGLARHRPGRLVAGTVVAAPALGLGFARYLRDQGDPWFWGMALGWATVCLVAAFLGRRRDGSGSARPGDPTEVERVAEERVVGDHTHRDAGAAGLGEGELRLEPLVPVTVRTHR